MYLSGPETHLGVQGRDKEAGPNQHVSIMCKHAHAMSGLWLLEHWIIACTKIPKAVLAATELVRLHGRTSDSCPLFNHHKSVPET